MSLIDRCPALYSLSPETLGATLEALAELTGLQVFQVPQLVSADPALLLQPDRLKANMRGVAQALGVRPGEVTGMGSREPSVLALSGEEVEGRLAALQRLLGLQPGGYDDLIAALLRNPGALLLPEPTTIEAQLQALESALDAFMGEDEREEEEEGQAAGPVGNGPAAGGISTSPSSPAASSPAGGPAAAAAAAAASAATVAEPRRHQTHQQPPQQLRQQQHSRLRGLVGRLVLSKPSLLSTPPQLLAGRVVHLADKAGVTPAKVLPAAIAGPDLLAASSCHIDRHCAALATALSHAGGCAGGAAEAAALLVSAPSLLGQSVGSLSAKWVLTAAVFRAVDSWERRLAVATVGERAELLAAPHARLVRLRFLAERGLQDVDPFAAMRVSDALFHLTHPDFRAWQMA